MSGRVLSVLLCGLLLSPSRAAATPVFELTVQSQSERSHFGTGFVVRDWRNSTDPQSLLLVTALHVLYRADKIEVRATCIPTKHELKEKGREPLWTISPDAGPSRESERNVLLWPEYDLAAIPVPARMRDTLVQFEEPGRMDFSSKSPTRGSLLRIRGITRYNECISATVEIFNHTSIERHMEFLAAQNPKSLSAAAMRGSVRPDAKIIHSQGPQTFGASGAPLTPPNDHNRVLAIHQAGIIEHRVSWAISVAESRIPDTEPGWALIGNAQSWPAVQLTDQRQAANLEGDPELDQKTRRLLVLGRERTVAAGGFLLRGNLDPADLGDWYTWIHFSIGQEILLMPLKTPSMSLAFGASLGPILGQVQQALFGPDGVSLERQRFMIGGILFEVYPRINFNRLGRWRPAIEVGFHGGPYSYVQSKVSSKVPGLLGFPFRLLIGLEVPSYHTLVVQFEVLPSWKVNSSNYYTGFGGELDTSRTTMEFTLFGGAGIRYEH